MFTEHKMFNDNSLDYVFSFGAVGMYCINENQLIFILKEMIRICKKNGKILITHFSEKNNGSILFSVSKEFWKNNLKLYPEIYNKIEDIKIKDMINQKKRYSVFLTKID